MVLSQAILWASFIKLDTNYKTFVAFSCSRVRKFMQGGDSLMETLAVNWCRWLHFYKQIYTLRFK